MATTGTPSLWCIRLALPAIAIAASGCGGFGGPVWKARDKSRFGAEVGWRGYPGDSEGLVLGVSNVVLPPVKGEVEDQWDYRGRLAAGYGVLPLPHVRKVGLEMIASPTYAWVAGHEHAVGLTGELALLWRFTRGAEPWEQNTIAEPIAIVMPTLSMEELWVFREERFRTNWLLGLHFRFVRWPTIAP